MPLPRRQQGAQVAAPGPAEPVIATSRARSRTMSTPTNTERYAKVIEVSKRVRWEIERDVIRSRHFDYTKAFLPSGLSLVNELAFLNQADKRLLSQVQGRTYA